MKKRIVLLALVVMSLIGLIGLTGCSGLSQSSKLTVPETYVGISYQVEQDAMPAIEEMYVLSEGMNGAKPDKGEKAKILNKADMNRDGKIAKGEAEVALQKFNREARGSLPDPKFDYQEESREVALYGAK